MLTHQFLIGNMSEKRFKVRLNSSFFRERQVLNDAWTIYIGGSYSPRPSSMDHLDWFILDPSLESSDEFEFEIGYNETVIILQLTNSDIIEVDENTLYLDSVNYMDEHEGLYGWIAYREGTDRLAKRYSRFEDNPAFFVEEVE